MHGIVCEKGRTNMDSLRESGLPFSTERTQKPLALIIRIRFQR